MADQKVSNLPALNGADVDSADLLYIVDSSAGTAGSKKITIGQYQLAPVSGGTANGVTYLNASKVLTSGSALTFDGTNLGIGTSSPAAKLNVAGTFRQNDATNSYGYTVTAASSKTVTASAFGGGYFSWQVNNSGSDAMTLDASGNLGLGGVTPANWSGLSNAGVVEAQSYALVNIGTNAVDFAQNANGNGAGNYKYRTTEFASKYTQIQGQHRFFTAPSGTAGNAITFTQAMTLTSGGELLVGTTSSAGAGGITLFNNTGVGFSVVNNNNAGATGYVFESFRRSSVEIGSVTQNGTTGVLYNITSDRRLKDNIVPAPSASNDIDAIQIVSHDWKSAPDEHVKYGVIAQDLHAVAPQAVLQGDDGDEIEKTWGVDYSKLVPMLIKEIQSLRARVAALEAK